MSDRNRVFRAVNAVSMLSALVLAGACSRSSQTTRSARPAIRLIAPPTNSVDVAADSITIEFAGTDLVTAHVRNPSVNLTTEAIGQPLLSATQGATVFLAFNVILQPGANVLDVEGTTANGGNEHVQIAVASTPGDSLFSVIATPETVNQLPAASNLIVQENFVDPPREVLVDEDGDGQVDIVSAYSTQIPLSFSRFGRFTPSLSARFSNGVMLTATTRAPGGVVVLPAPAAESGTSFVLPGSPVRDLAVSSRSRRVFALSSADNAVVLFNPDGTLETTVSLNNVSGASGIDVAGNDDILIADTGNGQVVRLAAADGYVTATTFGQPGSGKGQLDHPDDVAVAMVNGAERIFVSDTGNHRIVCFNADGSFALAFDGQGSALGGLQDPRGLVGLGGGVAVADRGAGLVRLFGADGSSVGFMGGPGDGESALVEPIKVSSNPSTGHLAVTDQANRTVRLYSAAGTLSRSVGPDANDITSAAINLGSARLELLVAPAGTGGLEVYELSEDPPSEAPVDIVTRFLAALGAADLNAVRSYLPTTRFSLLSLLETDPAVLEKAAANARATHDLTVAEMTEGLARVVGVTTVGGVDRNVQFSLSRDPRTSAWKVATF